jgi:indole-3-glycerol phosphate synthase
MNNLPAHNVLDAIVAHKREEVAQRKQHRPLSEWVSQVAACTQPHALERAIRQATPKPACILEIKPASPSAGVLQETLDLASILPIYAQYGVAISVLTDAHYFGGSLALLQSVRNQVTLPTLCKDFIIDPYQVYEARQAGAQAVLLIVKALSDAQLTELNALVLTLNMTPLIEVQDAEEVKRALKINPSILLINNRNLQSLKMDLSTTERLSPLIPEDILKIAASGIQDKADILRLQPHCDGFLIGSTLMRQPTPEALAKKLQELLA